MSTQLLLGDCLEVMGTLPAESVDVIITDPPYGLGYMGRQWDHGVPGSPVWAAALRVAKPGAYLLAFGGTRTHHRLMCAIEDAGWTIRDCLMWLYSSGFPKSHDIAKAIDREAGAEREVVGYWKPTGTARPGLGSKGHSAGLTSSADGERFPDDEVRLPITVPATEDAKRWDGWGTSLKPAWEPIIMAMKPVEGTIAQNAVKHGVAGLNVDGVRSGPKQNRTDFQTAAKAEAGRWPANLIIDKEAGSMLDAQARSHEMKERRDLGLPDKAGLGGGTARFFYCPKVSKKERDGSTHPTVKPIDLMVYLCKLTSGPGGGTVLDPFMGSGTTGVAARRTGRDFIGIEIDPESFRGAKARVS